MGYGIGYGGWGGYGFGGYGGFGGWGGYGYGANFAGYAGFGPSAWLGSVTEIPLNKVVSFVHVAI